jgi:hypothetical protein
MPEGRVIGLRHAQLRSAAVAASLSPEAIASSTLRR